MFDILSCLSYCPKILFPNSRVASKLINFYISSSYPPPHTNPPLAELEALGKEEEG